MTIAVCILAKDEGEGIAEALAQIARQTFVSRAEQRIDVHVVANGCTDNTVPEARRAASYFADTSAKLHVHDLHPGGKSRSWNTVVHALTDDRVQTFIFLDADIVLSDDTVIFSLLESLASDPKIEACSGFPVKDVSTKRVKSPLDLFSLAISSRTRHVGVINGSLYAAKAATLREIWLPNETPGEDGFLNAMITTRGFTRPSQADSVRMATRPTHFFEAHDPLQFFDHERRIIVGTVINRWIFEYLWSLDLKRPAGEKIAEWNRDDPHWVEKIIAQRGSSRNWVIPNAIMFGRFKSNGARPLWKRMANIPLAVAATLLTLPPALKANRRLKSIGSASSW
jgi:glycosyltransferase involved in cell wall biosynthesis